MSRCYLCGGKLLNGYCPDCGLDNSKNEKKRYRLNESSLETNTRRRQEEKDSSEWTQGRESRDENREASFNLNQKLQAKKPDTRGGYAAAAGNGYKLNKKQASAFDTKKVTQILLTVIAVLAVLVGPVLSFVKDKQTEVVQVYETEAVEQEEYDPYKYVTHELASEGEHFEIELRPGAYKVGVHIPEGNYQASLMEGSGYIDVTDSENSIYLWQPMGQDEENGELKEWTDARLYQGAKLQVTGNVSVRLVSENAQESKMAASIGNPLSEPILLKKGEQTIAGEDFPEGVYDLEAISDWCSVSYQIPLHTDFGEEEETFLEQSVFLTPDANDSKYCNAVLPAGAVITAEDADILMTPSEWIESEDYDSYYDEYQY